MFYKYEIKNNGTEDILYLYLTMSYEFSKELGYNTNDSDMTRRTKNFIENKGINFNGSKVYLVIDDIIVKALDIGKDQPNIELLKDALYYSNDHYLVKLKLENGAMIEITLREFLLGTLSSIIVPNLEKETLKAICVLYRTYAFKEMQENGFISSTNQFMIYKPISYYKLSWITNYDDIVKNLNTIMDETDCIFVTYNHSYILPYIHYCNNGKTQANKSIHYLNEVLSLWDLASPYYINIKDYSYQDISKLLKTKITNKSIFKILNMDNHTLLSKFKIDDSIYIGEEFIKLLDLKSRDLNIIINRDYIRFISKGWGEFLGLSIFGSNEIARNGCNFANIIKYYFPNVTLNKYIKELS